MQQEDIIILAFILIQVLQLNHVKQGYHNNMNTDMLKENTTTTCHV